MVALRSMIEDRKIRPFYSFTWNTLIFSFPEGVNKKRPGVLIIASSQEVCALARRFL